MKKKLISIIIIVLAVISLLALLPLLLNKGGEVLEEPPCSHEWEYATCTQAKECKICGETVGSKLGHNWLEATCETPKTCRRCNITEGVALGHTTTTGECARCHTNFSSWDSGVYKDEFGNPTSKKYISTTCYDGVFSNSATTNSTLYAVVQIDNSDIAIMLWEYGSHLVKGTFDSENYAITILDENGTKHYFTGTIYKSGTRIYFKEADKSKIITLLSQNDEVSIYLESTKYSISKYLFTISTAGFVQAYNGL